MKGRSFFVLAIMILGIGLTIWSFFGGNPNSQNLEIIQEEVSFAQELVNTGDISSGGNIDNSGDTQNIESEPTQQSYTQVDFMMPRYFYNQGWKKFAEDLYKENRIYMNFIFIDDLNSYREYLSNPDFSEADLFLFPYDWHEMVSTKEFSPQQSIQLYYDNLLTPITKNNPVLFLPFSADPMVMYAISGYTSTNSFYNISEFVFDREPIRPLSFPFFFGIDSEDFYNRGFLREYQDIVRYALMHYFVTNNDSYDLQTLVDSNVLKKYNIQDLNTISNIISTPECKYFPSLCFQVYNFVGIRFGFLSDADIINQYLKIKKSDFTSIQKLTLPFSQIESPVRIRGRGIRKSLEDSKTVNAIYLLFKQYMNNHDEYNLWNTTLPVFQSNETSSLIDNDYIGLRGYILQSGGDFIKNLKESSTKFQDLIEYKITAKEYLK